MQVAAETEPTLSVQVLEVSGCVCGRLLLDQAGTLAVDWQEKGRSSAAGLGGRRLRSRPGWDASGESLLPTSSATMMMMSPGDVSLREGIIGELPLPTISLCFGRKSQILLWIGQ